MEAIKDFFTYLFLYPIIGVCAILLYAVLLWILSNSINFLFNDIFVSKKNKTTELKGEQTKKVDDSPK
jgi:hypothetical protein